MAEGGSIFSGGMPVRPDVEKLKKAFPIKPEVLITHEQLESVLELKRKSMRYRTIVASWKRAVEREQLIRLDAEKGIGYRALNPEQAISRSGKDLEQNSRAVRKGTIRVEMINATGLSEETKGQHSLLRRYFHLINDVCRQARKEIAAPEPTVPPAATEK